MEFELLFHMPIIPPFRINRLGSSNYSSYEKSSHLDCSSEDMKICQCSSQNVFGTGGSIHYAELNVNVPHLDTNTV